MRETVTKSNIRRDRKRRVGLARQAPVTLNIVWGVLIMQPITALWSRDVHVVL